MMIEADEIWLNRAEGPRGQVGERTVTGPNIWSKAADITRQWSYTAPGPDGGYDKTDFKVTFANGYVYQGRLDITQSEYLLDAHILSELRFLASDTARAIAVRETQQLSPAPFVEFLCTYQIGD